MEIRKIQQNGTSKSVVIPTKYLKSLKLNVGDLVRMELNVNQSITMRKVENNGS